MSGIAKGFLCRVVRYVLSPKSHELGYSILNNNSELYPEFLFSSWQIEHSVQLVLPVTDTKTVPGLIVEGLKVMNFTSEPGVTFIVHM